MKSVVRFIAVCILVFISEVIFSQTAADYYLPLSVGSQLNLHTTSSASTWWGFRATLYTIEGADVISGQQCFRELGTELSDVTSELDTFRIFWLRKDIDGNVILSAISIDGTSNPDSALIIDFNYFPNEFLSVGYSRTYSFGDISQDSVLSVTETVTVSAGTFNNCIVILETQFDNTGNPIFYERHYYANGVGMIKNVRTLPDSEAHTDDLISYIATGVNDEVSNQTPNNYLLSQNYPNPFNPSTRIQYSINSSEFVNLKVYDVLGNEIATLVNEEKSAGTYEVEFGIQNLELTSGIYFYQLKAGNYSAARKMLMLK